MYSEHAAAVAGTYLKNRLATRIKKRSFQQYRHKLSVAVRLATKKSVRSLNAFRFTELASSIGQTKSAVTQTDVHAPLKTFADQAVQVDSSCILCCFPAPDTSAVPLEPAVIKLAPASTTNVVVAQEELNSVLSESSLDVEASLPTSVPSGMVTVSTSESAVPSGIPPPLSVTSITSSASSSTAVKIHPLCEDLFHPPGETHYRVKVGNTSKLLTRQEQKELPATIKPKTYSLTAEKRKALRNRIRRRVSKKFREKESTSKLRHMCKKQSKDLPPIKELRYTRTIRNLISYFVDQYTRYHEAGLPMRMEESDSDHSDDEYYERTIQCYHNKPPNYEALLVRSLPKDAL